MNLKIGFAVLFLLIICGCEEPIITDPVTPESPAIVEKQRDSIIVMNDNDGMARRNLEYISQDKGKLVVDPNYYKQYEFKRGDVIYLKEPAIDKNKYPNINPPETSISRVIALPGEDIQIKKGQVYLNGKKLATFYGKALSWRLNEEEYFNTVNQPGTMECNESCQKTMKDYFSMDMEKVTVPDGHLFVMGDTWWRSIDSQIYGPLPVGNVIGKVQGYEKK